MKTEGKDSSFLFVLDYILNKADTKELEVFIAAIERRKNSVHSSLSGITLDPEQAAKKMSEAVYASIDASMDSVRKTFREYAAGLLEKEAPELSRDRLDYLLDSWIPSVSGTAKNIRRSLAQNGTVQGIPADLLHEMIIQFVSYSLGEMPADTQRELDSAMQNWTRTYWQRFPTGVRQEIKSFLSGEISSGAFQRNIRELLGLV
ncbi:MAG: hypothetical protein P1P60_00175 [Treponema phagedenis]|uniref:hypothetical protein n=1 Tax=Treponema phagedenis TaxID=162 RepID=UPI0031341992